MLAKIAPASRDFKALAQYLVRGKGQASDRRVAWTQARNLPTEDPSLASKLMEATARLSVRTRNPVYHVMIAWAPHERPTPDVMQAIAGQALELTGLGEHQALIIGHGDTAHPHLHMMINRVHPETGTSWKTAHDFRLFDRVMRQLAEAHGFTHAPSHAFNPDETATAQKLPATTARRAGERGADTLRPQWSRRDAEKLSRRISEDLDPASGPDDIEHTLSRLGLHIEAKGSGHVVGNADGYVKASSLGLSFDTRMPMLARRRSLELVDGVDIVRALQLWGLADENDLETAIDDARAARDRQRGARQNNDR